ncbi:MAG: hypothetical protein LAO30_21165 [Acidobacteriia bacterium]|nr:hypothetical protein [Terriglobia bacterium]
MVPTENMDKIMGALVFLGTVELFFTLLIAVTCWLVLVGCGILSQATPALLVTAKPRKAGLVRLDL